MAIGSGASELIDAVLRCVVPALVSRIRTTTVTVAVAPEARLPSAQLIAVVQLPWLGVTETRSTPPGRLSVSVTPPAGLGPPLRAVST